MRTIAREHFIDAIEAGIAATSLAPWKVNRLRELGETAEHTLVYSFKRVEGGVAYHCPIVAVVGVGQAIGDDGWDFVFAFDKAAAGCVAISSDEDYRYGGPIKVVD